VSALEILEPRGLVNAEALDRLTDRLTDEAPDVMAVIDAIQTFHITTSEHLQQLADQTYDMRRSHLAFLIALLDQMRERLAEILTRIDLDGRLIDDSMIDTARNGLDAVGGTLAEVVQGLFIKNP
jgi:hypothetical protein